MRFRNIVTFLVVCFFVGTPSLAADTDHQPDQQTADQAALQQAADWIGAAETVESEFRYVMTCRVRLLLFWAGRDDVGGGYVRIGKATGSDPQKMVRVLFGSDPTKAPLSINRWGAGTEVMRSGASGQPGPGAFFGFMKSSKGQSVLAMRRELSDEKNEGEHLFDGIISRVDEDRAISTTIPYESAQDFDFHQYAQAEKVTLAQLESNPSRHIRQLEGAARQACPRTGEFLSTILQLIDDAMAQHSTPDTLCYVYNARLYRATLLRVDTVAEKKVHVTLRGSGGALDQTYHHLLETHFAVTNEESGVISPFEIALGTEGKLRGAPVQITYQPNWWFQIILNLAPDAPQAKQAALSSR